MKGVINTASLSKQEKKEKQERLYNKAMWIPVWILLAIVPLITKMVRIDTSGNVLDILNETQVGDVYANYKSTAIVVLCVIMAVIGFLCFEKENIKWDNAIKLYLIGTVIFLGVSLIATLHSDNAHTAWWGMPDRAEGFVMNVCYVFMALYTLYVLRDNKNYTYIIIGLSLLIVLTTIIGAFQYFGYDLFTNVTFIKNMILGEEGIQLGLDLTSDYESGKVFGTMNHYNYMGSFGAMMVPFFFVLLLFIKDNKKKIGFAFIMLCSMFLLFGSQSRAGFIGLVMSLLAILIIFMKLVIRKWKITVPIIVALIGVLFGFNAITGGTIFARIPSLINESIGLFSGSDETFNYLDHIPVRGITYEEGRQKIELQQHTLYVGYEENTLSCTDEEGNAVEYISELGLSNGKATIIYTTTDERFNLFSFRMEEVVGAKEGEAPIVFSLVYKDVLVTFTFMVDTNKGVIMIDSCPIEEEQIEFPEAIGFKGKEKLGSARGYIWSRSLPLMRESILIGYGPDNYALVFPQNDYLGKWWAYDNPNMIVDKAHSLYMGMWVNNGGLALIGFLLVMITYIVQSMKLYALKDTYRVSEILGIASFVAVIGYLGAGIFNDTIVSVTPIFMILLGAGMGINYYVNKDNKEQQKRLSKVVTINP